MDFINETINKIDRELEKLVNGDEEVYNYIKEHEDKWRWWTKWHDHTIYRIRKPYSFTGNMIRSRKLNIKAALENLNSTTLRLIKYAKRKQNIYYPIFIFDLAENWKKWPLAQRVDQDMHGRLFAYKGMPIFDDNVKRKLIQNDMLGETIIDGIVETLIRRISK